MKYIEVVIDQKNIEIVKKIAENVKAKDLRHFDVSEDGMQLSRMIVTDDELQKAIDSFSLILGTQPRAKVAVLPLEAYLPKEKESEEKKEKKLPLQKKQFLMK
jgi:histidinol dehydrogenase